MSGERGPVATVVVCEADDATLALICDRLIADHFEALPARSVGDALRLCRHGRPDVLILDPSPADDSARELVRRARETDPRLGIIVLVSGGEGARTDVGADDSLVKPFRLDDLRARLDSVLRRHHRRSDAPVRVGEMLIDPGRRLVTVGDREVRPAKKEFTLLRVLAGDPTRVFAKEELLREVWGARVPAGRTRTLDSHASRLRRKLDPERARYVVNCWGVGYSLLSGEGGPMGPPDGSRGSEDRREFAGRLRRLMEIRGLSVAGLAERASIDVPTIEAILGAEHPVWLDEIYQLAGALGVEPGRLLVADRPEEGDRDA
jgi:DNA-binding response OmpR family regulator